MGSAAWLLLGGILGCGPGKDAAPGACAGGSCVEDCTNGRDDDGNGDADCADSACAAICPEACDNGVDDNGDWLVDCADPACATTCDGDFDGYTSDALPDGDDCDDSEASVHPGATEIYGDGLDNDCDPATDDADQDGDGVSPPDDCDDTDPDSYPGAPEKCGDGIENDCSVGDGIYPERKDCYGLRSLSSADYVLDGSEAEGSAGLAVVSGGKNLAEQMQVVIGAPGVGGDTEGAAYLVHGPFPRQGDLRTVGCEMVDESGGTNANLGSSLARVDDLDGLDGANVVIGAKYEDVHPQYRNGVAWVLGAVCTPGTIAASATEIAGYNHDEFGTSLGPAGDVTGDGRADLLVGLPLRDVDIDDAGGAAVFDGPISGIRTVDQAWALIAGTEKTGYAGSAVAGVGDLDGDGLDDLLIGQSGYDPSGVGQGSSGAGAAWAVVGVPTGETHLEDWLKVGEGLPGDQLGAAVVSMPGDLTGDGRTDLVISAPLADAGTGDEGAVYVIDSVAPLDTAATLQGAQPGESFGAAVAVVDDINGDERPDLVVGAPHRDVDDGAATLIDAGAVYGFFGPLAGTMDPSVASFELTGEAQYDYAGTSVASGDDLDGEGHDDLIVGAPFHDGTFPGAGRVYLMTFEY